MKLVQVVPPTLIEYTLTKSTLILGGDSEADIRIEGEGIFAKHAVIWGNRGLYAISDWAKQGALWVNGVAVVSGQALRTIDEIKLGNVILKFVPDNVSAEQSQIHAVVVPSQTLLDPMPSPSEKLHHISPETRAQLRRISLCPPENAHRLWQRRYFRRMKQLQKLGKRRWKKARSETFFNYNSVESPTDRCHQFWHEYSQSAFNRHPGITLSKIRYFNIIFPPILLMLIMQPRGFLN